MWPNEDSKPPENNRVSCNETGFTQGSKVFMTEKKRIKNDDSFILNSSIGYL